MPSRASAQKRRPIRPPPSGGRAARPTNKPVQNRGLRGFSCGFRQYCPWHESTYRRQNGGTDDEVAADREDLCRDGSSEEGRQGGSGDAGNRRLQGTEEVRKN